MAQASRSTGLGGETETETFAGRSLDIHTSDQALYVVGPDERLRDTTLVTYVDISDPAGDIAERD